MKLNSLLKIERVQWHGGIQKWGLWRLQHNYLLVRPSGYEVAKPPSADTLIVLFDPWLDLRPGTYSTKTHSYPGMNTGIRTF